MCSGKCFCNVCAGFVLVVCAYVRVVCAFCVSVRFVSGCLCKICEGVLCVFVRCMCVFV